MSEMWTFWAETGTGNKAGTGVVARRRNSPGETTDDAEDGEEFFLCLGFYCLSLVLLLVLLVLLLLRSYSFLH